MNNTDEIYMEKLEKIQKRISPEHHANTLKRMGLAARIYEGMHTKGLTNQEFAFLMGKKPAEISRWLSGTHNFTTETLWELERVLGIQLVAGAASPTPDALRAFIIEEIQKAFERFNWQMSVNQ